MGTFCYVVDVILKSHRDWYWQNPERLLLRIWRAPTTKLSCTSKYLLSFLFRHLIPVLNFFFRHVSIHRKIRVTRHIPVWQLQYICDFETHDWIHIQTLIFFNRWIFLYSLFWFRNSSKQQLHRIKRNEERWETVSSEILHMNRYLTCHCCCISVFVFCYHFSHTYCSPFSLYHIISP